MLDSYFQADLSFILTFNILPYNMTHPDTQAIIDHYQFDRIPVEGTFYKSTYRATQQATDGTPVGTAILAMYAEYPKSVSCFHRLPYDEVWHFYGGDPLQLYLLKEGGEIEVITMGSEPLQGQRVQFVVPANTWQAGEIQSGGRYALFGCTMAPGFMGKDFEAAVLDELLAQYPAHKALLRRLSVNEDQTEMPEGYIG